MPEDIEITIGWTRSEVVDGKLIYSSFGDGYRPGASQHTETITIRRDGPPASPTLELVEHIAEAVFAATNDPGMRPDAYGNLAQRIRHAIDATGYRGQGAHYSLSVGDTVTVNEVMLACEGSGWRRVTDHTPNA